MKLSTMTVPTIEMTMAEWNILRYTPCDKRRVLGAKVIDWYEDDGHNEIRLDGEDFYRKVIVKK